MEIVPLSTSVLDYMAKDDRPLRRHFQGVFAIDQLPTATDRQSNKTCLHRQYRSDQRTGSTRVSDVDQKQHVWNLQQLRSFANPVQESGFAQMVVPLQIRITKRRVLAGVRQSDVWSLCPAVFHGKGSWRAHD